MASQREESAGAVDEAVTVAAAGTAEGTDGEADAGEAAPPPPPPPPAVGSMLSFPGGMFIPKNYDRGWGTVSVRVVITVDELGNVIAAEVDPTMRASIDAINEWALGYALQLVQAQPGPEGQAYQASFVIRFDPDAEGTRGVTFGTDPEAHSLIACRLTGRNGFAPGARAVRSSDIPRRNHYRHRGDNHGPIFESCGVPDV